MLSASATPLTRHFFTVDVEEYFHVSAFESVVGRDQWSSLPRRLDWCIPRLLEHLEAHEVKGTFFILGWVAAHCPHIVRQIAAAKHEIASHGFWHRRVHSSCASEFRDDVRASKVALEDLTGEAVHGYRAPSFSIVPGTEWAFDVLIEEGFSYDSSLFPIRRRGYGYPGTGLSPHVLRRAAGRLVEFPLATTSMFGYRLPAAGGGYLRHLPFWFIRHAFDVARSQGVPSTFYIHPWEIDPQQPRLSVDHLTRVRHYRGLSQTSEKLDRLLAEFSFTTIASFLQGAQEAESVAKAN
jgi:polysaccharide deacetylase family protein (PEP-CTERM system associated)